MAAISTHQTHSSRSRTTRPFTGPYSQRTSRLAGAQQFISIPAWPPRVANAVRQLHVTTEIRARRTPATPTGLARMQWPQTEQSAMTVTRVPRPTHVRQGYVPGRTLWLVRRAINATRLAPVTSLPVHARTQLPRMALFAMTATPVRRPIRAKPAFVQGPTLLAALPRTSVTRLAYATRAPERAPIRLRPTVPRVTMGTLVHKPIRANPGRARGPIR